MRMRALGDQGLVVAELALGCMGMSEFYAGAAGGEASIAVIHRALDLGVTMIDTADMYGPFTNERLVGRALRGRREGVVLATKFGNQRRPDGTWIGVNGRPDYVRQACDASLQRLGVDCIDLYYQHRVDRAVPIEETVGAMGELVRQGKVRFLGLSEAGAATLRRARREFPISALQTEYSLWSRDVEAEILPAARELGVGFVAYSPLGRGFLAGRFAQASDLAPGDVRAQYPRFSGDNFERNFRLARRLRERAALRGVTAAQLALAWLLDRGPDIVPLFGTTHPRRLEENLGAAALELTPPDREFLSDVFQPAAVAGERYPEDRMRSVDV